MQAGGARWPAPRTKKKHFAEGLKVHTGPEGHRAHSAAHFRQALSRGLAASGFAAY